jgi:hypothetical protein
MPIIVSYEQASGPSIADAAFLAQRHDADQGFIPEQSECWIMAVRSATGKGDASELRAVGGTLGWYTGLWRSPSGRVYVTSSSGQVVSNPNLWDTQAQWDDNQLGPPLVGVWGIDDRCVFAWGATWQKEYKVFRFDGTRWSELPTPGFDVRAMHGIAPDLVHAVGIGGRIARWDGGRWTEPSSPVGENLTSVFVAGPDEIYATGAAGSLLEGSAHGWGVITTLATGGVGLPLHAVAKWRGDLWIGGGAQGLFKRVGTTGQLDCIKPNIKAFALDARKDLVMTMNELIVGTSDGQAFTGVGKMWLENERAGRALGDVT